MVKTYTCDHRTNRCPSRPKEARSSLGETGDKSASGGESSSRSGASSPSEPIEEAEEGQQVHALLRSMPRLCTHAPQQIKYNSTCMQLLAVLVRPGPFRFSLLVGGMHSFPTTTRVRMPSWVRVPTRVRFPPMNRAPPPAETGTSSDIGVVRGSQASIYTRRHLQSCCSYPILVPYHEQQGAYECATCTAASCVASCKSNSPPVIPLHPLAFAVAILAATRAVSNGQEKSV